MTRKERESLRRAVADYMRSEGCSCCRNIDDHNNHKRRLAELLHVEPYEDGSGFDFRKYESRVTLEGTR